ncbi:unnamed protein product [Darwinula stevensoni]|uniref:Uncharacterized protein n=1 Tax=Darwinula stevensoni TaxID=69355 RepID=A0A7R8WXV7_9CRUS|nr:unnamed protein product [Darwinula stevensoni]CAG0878728.1 unnamed protein product [Darwinula stevensoni]
MSHKSSHLRLQKRNLKTLPEVPRGRRIRVAYLHENALSGVDSLGAHADTLTLLYLDFNCVEDLTLIGRFVKLEKLYLNCNRIRIVEGLECLKSLRELHLRSQALQEGEQLVFDPRTVRGLQGTLEILDISKNRITSLAGVKGFQNLTFLDASHNELEDFEETLKHLISFPSLQNLSLNGNPLERSVGRHYTTGILASLHHLAELGTAPFPADPGKVLGTSRSGVWRRPQPHLPWTLQMKHALEELGSD